MSGILRLDEKHKRCVDLVIRGTPRNEIAEELGVSRSTVFAWMNDPLIQAYREKVEMEMQAARRMRILSSFLKTMDLYDATMAEVGRKLNSTDPEDRLDSAAIKAFTAVAAVAKTMFGMERTDSGNPSQISETQHTLETGAPRKRSKFEIMMDEVVVDGEKVIEAEVVVEEKS